MSGSAGGENGATVPAAADAAPTEENVAKVTYRSYKKKYLKMRHVFREKMRESNTLYDEEQRLERIARRLQEQNDQLLELLLDINDSNKIPAHLRFDLRSPPPDAATGPGLTRDIEPPSAQKVQEANAALQEAKVDFANGELDEQTYQSMEASLSAIINQTQSLASLSKTSHSTLACVPPEQMPSELTEERPVGYMSPAHEEEYLANMDEYLASNPPWNVPLPPKPAKLSEREREKDAQLNNPMSVYNWLAHHRPKVFETAEDAAHDKPPKPRKSSPKPTPNAARGSKRDRIGASTAAAVPKVDEELLDDDGFVIAGGLADAGGQKKRKRGADDDAYRPKGGSSRKRKRGGSGVMGKKGELGEE